jgi:FixJ family two-component response regulator
VTEHKGTIFVVDDDEGIRRSLELLLNSVGLEVQSFASTTEFLTAYDPDAAGCLLLDVRLPTISGLALQEQLRSMHSMLPIIFITAHADVPLAVRAMHAGAFDFLKSHSMIRN